MSTSERGIGVAVITRRSTRLALAGEREALTDAEAMLLVDDREAEIGEDDAFLEQRMRADRDVDFARRERRQRLAPLGGLVAAGQQRDAQARLLGERRHPLEMLARENFGRRHHRRLPPGLDHLGHREQRDDRLARADVALQQPDHALLRPRDRRGFRRAP